jgi:hypothetical protein
LFQCIHCFKPGDKSWIRKWPDMCSCKQLYVTGSTNCSTKSLFKLLTSILSAVKSGFQSYCDTSYSAVSKVFAKTRCQWVWVIALDLCTI